MHIRFKLFYRYDLWIKENNLEGRENMKWYM